MIVYSSNGKKIEFESDCPQEVGPKVQPLEYTNDKLEKLRYEDQTVDPDNVSIELVPLSGLYRGEKQRIVFLGSLSLSQVQGFLRTVPQRKVDHGVFLRGDAMYISLRFSAIDS